MLGLLGGGDEGLRSDLDFNLSGGWYFRIGLFENFDSTPPWAVQERLRLVEYLRPEIVSA